MTNVDPVESQSADMPGMFRRYRPSIIRGLRQGLASGHPQVYDILRYYTGWVDVDGNPCVSPEGKALRPTLCLFACEAAGGAPGMAMPAAVALEFIHNFSLIHDDIQDGDATRHHRPTVWAVWGVAKALVAGNVLRAVADMSLSGLLDKGLDPDRTLMVTEVLTEAYLEMIEGQYLDISFEGRPDIGMSEYLAMISRKTGALIRCSLNLGAVIASHDSRTIESFRECGRSLGYVFQIRDDVMGVWGDLELTGKPVGDIQRKKNSLPVVHAMAQAKGQDKDALVGIYEKQHLTDDDVATVLDVMERVDTRGFASRLAAEHGEQALEALSGVELAPEARREVEDLVDFLLVRDH